MTDLCGERRQQMTLNEVANLKARRTLSEAGREGQAFLIELPQDRTGAESEYAEKAVRALTEALGGTCRWIAYDNRYAGEMRAVDMTEWPQVYNSACEALREAMDLEYILPAPDAPGESWPNDALRSGRKPEGQPWSEDSKRTLIALAVRKWNYCWEPGIQPEDLQESWEMGDLIRLGLNPPRKNPERRQRS